MKLKQLLYGFAQSYLPVLTWLTNIALLVMMLITVVDVLCRSLNAPILGSIELTQYALTMMVVSAFPIVITDEDHISVDLLEPVIPQLLAVWRDIFIHLLAAIAFIMITAFLYKLSGRAFRDGEMTMFLHLPKGYILSFMALMGCVAALSSIMRAIHRLMRIGSTHQQN